MLLNEERLKLSATKLQPLICYWKLFIMAGCCTGNLRNAWPPLQWRHNGRDSVSNHQPHDCLLNRLCRHRSKKTSKLRVTGLCAGNSPGTGGFPAQMASNAENVSIWWRHYAPTVSIVDLVLSLKSPVAAAYCEDFSTIVDSIVLFVT